MYVELDYTRLNVSQQKALNDFRKLYVPSIWEESEKDYSNRHGGYYTMTVKTGRGVVIASKTRKAYREV